MFFNKFDFLSPHITLYYNNNKRHLSPLGGLLTIIIFSFSIYMLINFFILIPFPKTSSLIMYRNFETDITNNYFNDSGLFHFIYIYNNESIENDDAIQINSLKRGIIRIYMTYTYYNLEYNSSNLKDNDHWVYDTCNYYVNEDDIKYDYSFSSCIKYYYNSIDKKYYYINYNINFKWPYLRENITNIENTFFAIYIEKCSNNSILNNILGNCTSEEKVNEYLSSFNNIFISFIDNKIQNNNDETPIKIYSHQLHDTLINNDKFFYLHEMKFIPFNFEEAKKIMGKKFNNIFFMFDNDRISKIYNKVNNKLLVAYIFNFKKYINEFKKQDNYILRCFYEIGGASILLYFIFYFFNYILNERIEVRNFQFFLNDKGNKVIHKHINYERNTKYSLKSNMYTNFSNEGNEAYNCFKSTYHQNLMKHDVSNLSNLSNLSNINNSNNNSRINDNNYALNIEKVKTEGKEKSKNSDKVIVINNGTFNNEGNINTNNKINMNINRGKIKSSKFVNKMKDFDSVERVYKTYTYNISQKEKNNDKDKEPQQINNQALLKNKEDSSTINFSNYAKKRILDFNIKKKNYILDYSSRQKILDNSSLSLLNLVNKTKNIHISNSNNNLIQNKEVPEIPLLNLEKSFESISPKNHRIHKKNNFSLPKENLSQKNLISVSRKNENGKNLYSKKLLNKISSKERHFSKNVFNLNLSLEKKKRRKSHQLKNTYREKEKEKDNDNCTEKNKNRKNKKKQKTGGFQNLPEKKKERHLSILSRNSNFMTNNNNKTINLYPSDNNSQINLSKNIIDHYKKFSNLYKIMGKKVAKEIASKSSEIHSKNLKKDKQNSLRCVYSEQQNQKLTYVIKNINLSPKTILNYLCLFRKNENNGVTVLNNFRHKLLSEEYLYILHLNMFIFKQKFGCKSNTEKINLLEELYNDY